MMPCLRRFRPETVARHERGCEPGARSRLTSPELSRALRAEIEVARADEVIERVLGMHRHEQHDPESRKPDPRDTRASWLLFVIPVGTAVGFAAKAHEVQNRAVLSIEPDGELS